MLWGVDTNRILERPADPWPSGHSKGVGRGCAPSCILMIGAENLVLFATCIQCGRLQGVSASELT